MTSSSDPYESDPSKDEAAFQRQIIDLVGGLCNGTLTDQQHEQLAELLENDPKARQYYQDYILVHVKLLERSVVQAYEGQEDALASCNLPSSVSKSSGGAERSTSGRSPDLRHLLSWLAVLAALVGFVLAAQVYLGNETEIAQTPTQQQEPDQDAEPSNKRPADTVDTPLYVAQISGVSADVRWGNPSNSREFLLRVRRGDRIEIEQGLIEVDYFSGAQLVLRGPCEFVPTGSSSGRLIRGQLTGNVTEGDFLLTTPTAEVVDLGTQFGVEIDASGNTDVCVLDGKVRVSSSHSDRSPTDSKLLEKGMAVHVARGEGITSLTDLSTDRFPRVLRDERFAEADELSLVGVLSGVRHNHFRLAGVIAADSGEPDRSPWLRANGPGHRLSNGYQTTSWHPFVDGVLIPSVSGAETQISSENHQVDLPNSMGRTWGPIWSRAKLDGAAAVKAQEDYWGTDTLKVVIAQLEQCQTGMIGMHSNVGVTFDLAAIKQQWSKTPVEFHSIVRNLDNSMERTPHWAKENRFSASLRVFVDGELRDSRLDFTRKDGELTLQAEILPSDRFLTLVSTDAGDYSPNRKGGRYDGFDHVVLIDPVLKMAKQDDGAR